MNGVHKTIRYGSNAQTVRDVKTKQGYPQIVAEVHDEAGIKENAEILIKR